MSHFTAYTEQFLDTVENTIPTFLLSSLTNVNYVSFKVQTYGRSVTTIAEKGIRPRVSEVRSVRIREEDTG